MSVDRLELQSISTTLHQQPKFSKPAVLSLNKTTVANNRKQILLAPETDFVSGTTTVFEDPQEVQKPVMKVNIAKVTKRVPVKLVPPPPAVGVAKPPQEEDYFITQYSFPKQLVKSKPAYKSE